MQGMERSARDILSTFDFKSKFIYKPNMEVYIPETDRKGSMDKISFSFRNEEVVLSDLYIAYAISLYQYTIPPVVANTITILGKLWPEKFVPKNATREELTSRMKKMCGMGMLRRYVYELNEQNIVLYATTVEGNKILHQLLKLRTDARYEKDILPEIDIISMAAASLLCSELLKSNGMKEFRFSPTFMDGEDRHTFYAEFVHETQGSNFTVVQPMFMKVDNRRFTQKEWEEYQKNKLRVLSKYMEYQKMKRSQQVHLILVLQDKEDFILVSSWVVTIFSKEWLDNIYFTSESAIKSTNGLNGSLIKISDCTYDEATKKNKIKSITIQEIENLY